MWCKRSKIGRNHSIISPTTPKTSHIHLNSQQKNTPNSQKKPTNNHKTHRFPWKHTSKTPFSASKPPISYQNSRYFPPQPPPGTPPPSAAWPSSCCCAWSTRCGCRRRRAFSRAWMDIWNDRMKMVPLDRGGRCGHFGSKIVAGRGV
jgi:hypothetical protein